MLPICRRSPGWTSVRTWPFVCGGLLAVILATGCNHSPESAQVSGQVTLDGKPLQVGNVSFFSKERGTGLSAPVGKDGSFELPEPLLPGEYQVMVLPPPPPPPTDPTRQAPLPDISAGQQIPQKYQNEATTDLTAQLELGHNVRNFELLTDD